MYRNVNWLVVHDLGFFFQVMFTAVIFANI